MALPTFLREKCNRSFLANLVGSGRGEGDGSSSSSSSDSTSSSSGSSSESAEASKSSKSSNSEDVDTGLDLQALKRRQRTEKARAQSLVNRAVRKAQISNPARAMSVHPADSYREDLLSTSQLTKPGVSHASRKRRLRLLWSWFSAWTGSIFSFLWNSESATKIRHALNICIVDDTNMRLTPVETEIHRSKRSRVVSCMNNVQTLLFNVSTDNGSEAVEQSSCMELAESSYRSFLVHTPLLPLERTNAQGLATELISWVFLWLGSIGERFHQFNRSVTIQSSSLPSIPIQSLIICWDSLKTNIAVLKGLRCALFLKRKSMDDDMSGKPDKLFPLLPVRCAIHQVALCRKHLLFHFSGHWSAIVRLAHLFEATSFRTQFRKCLLKVISANFECIQVAILPAEHTIWQERRKMAGISKEDPRYQKRRLEAHRKLAVLDNSDPDSVKIIHWCIGPSCACGGSAKTALIRICQLYCELFCSGFAVPLTYRWLHAQPALAFCKDTWQFQVLLVMCRQVSVCSQHVELQNSCCPDHSHDSVDSIQYTVE